MNNSDEEKRNTQRVKEQMLFLMKEMSDKKNGSMYSRRTEALCVCVLFNLISFTYEQEQDGIPRQKQNNNHKKIEIVRALKL